MKHKDLQFSCSFRQPDINSTDMASQQVVGKNLSQQIDDFDFDIALPPPPDFQDNPPGPEIVNERICSPEQVTIIDTASPTHGICLGSLTPDGLSQNIRKESPKKCDRSMSLRSIKEGAGLTPENVSTISKARFDHSTPSTNTNHNRETLGFSPIQNENEVTEYFKNAGNDICSRNFPRATQSRSSIMTSTPKQKSILNYVKPSQTNEDLLLRSPKVKPCIACTRLSGSQVALVTQMTDKKLATFSSVFSSGVTHMIVAVDENNCLKDYTVKFVAAVAAGIWVLRFDWVQECLNHNRIVPEVR